eukprot:g7396.t1
MGDVPINPSGFAHGFRPLEGSDNPPPTPTQRNLTQRDVMAPGAGFLSALSQQPPGDAAAGAMGIGLGSSRKRRRLPGPLALLQQGHSGGTGQHEGGGGANDDNHRRQSDDSDGNEGATGGGHFSKGPWLSLCSAVDAPIPEDGDGDSRAAQTFLRSAVSPMSEVLSGDFDLRVPVVTAVVDSYTQLSVSDVIVELVDPSGRMKGYLHPGCLEEHGPFLGPGAALLLKEVSIFVSGPGTTRLLNVHPDCVLAVFPADSPLPAPSRLEWLKACEPPFTPRLVSDSGDSGNHGLTMSPPSHRTLPPPPPTTPAASSAARPRVATGRRRLRQLSDREVPEQESAQHHSQQQRETTPRVLPPAPRRWNSMVMERRGHCEEHREERREHHRHERQPQQPPSAAPDGGTPPTQDGETRNTPARPAVPDRQPPPACRSSSQSPSCPSPPGTFSQSQSERHHEHIPLGQHSDEEGGRLAAEKEAAPCGMIRSAASSGREASDRTRGDGHVGARGRLGASTAMKRARRESPVGVAQQNTSIREDGGRGGGLSAPPRNMSTRQVPPIRSLVSLRREDGGDGEGENVGGGVEKTTAAPMALGGDRRNGMALPRGGEKDAVGSEKTNPAALSPGSERSENSRGAGQPASDGHAAKDTPSVDHKRGETVGVGRARLAEDGAPVSAPFSIWADLDGLASGDDSTSGDDEGATRSRPAAPASIKAPSPPQDPASSCPAAVVILSAAGKIDRGATTIAGGTAIDGAERGEAPQLASGGVSQAARRAQGGGRVPSGNAGFSLLSGAGGSLGDNELLDAALEDSD